MDPESLHTAAGPTTRSPFKIEDLYPSPSPTPTPPAPARPDARGVELRSGTLQKLRAILYAGRRCVSNRGSPVCVRHRPGVLVALHTSRVHLPVVSNVCEGMVLGQKFV